MDRSQGLQRERRPVGSAHLPAPRAPRALQVPWARKRIEAAAGTATRRGRLRVGGPPPVGSVKAGEEPTPDSVPLRGVQGLSSQGGCSRGAGCPAGRPHSPRRPAQARHSGAGERTAAAALVAAAAGAAPWGGAGGGSREAGLATWAGGGPGTPTGARIRWCGTQTQSHRSPQGAPYSPFPARLTGSRTKESGWGSWPPGHPPPPNPDSSGENLPGRERDTQSATAPAPRTRRRRANHGGGSPDRYRSGMGLRRRPRQGWQGLP